MRAKVGDKHERLEIIAVLPSNVHGQRRFLCKCICGERVKLSSVGWGKTRSCGCLRREVAAAKATKDGRSAHPLYGVWKMMIQRCHTPTNKDYEDYGGRGIRVCDRWRNDFQAFADDMGPRPDGMTVERVNRDGNYEPSNCEWATWSAQAFNRRPKGSGRKWREKNDGC